MTGATGFLGSRLLPGLLAENQGTDIIALVRDEPHVAARRIDEALHAAGADAILRAHVHERVRPVQVVLTEPRLGLSELAFQDLADRLTAVWHSAATIDLASNRASMTLTNVEGTRQVLRLAEVGRRRPRVVHISTAFVAGRRNHSVIMEDDLDGSAGFDLAYEETKYEAELLVREWARLWDRPVVVLRPSGLVTDRKLPAKTPGHTLAVFADKVARLARAGGPGFASVSQARSLAIRTRIPQESSVNLVQIDYACRAMLAATRQAPVEQVATYHVTHPVDTPVRTIIDAVELAVPGLSVQLGSGPDGDATTAERFLTRAFEMFAALSDKQRQYDRSRLVAAAPGLADPEPVDLTYLTGALGLYADLASVTVPR